jgi:eukaryotic-like serine/threonine-protein kinase
MPDARPLQPGDPTRLGAYTVLGRLGEGGQGVVFLGRSESGEDVAIKLLRADLAQDETARGRFLRELAAVKRVARFCTAQVLAAEVEGDRPYIVSEYVPGPSLHQLVSSGSPRSGADLERLAIGTVTALVAIHQAGIVHRDFKPQNVLIASDGPRVIDFGIAKALDAAATMTNSAIGTPAYMAPEQLAGKEITPAADIFAWGSTMVYAATGQSPFGQDTVMAVIHRIINEPPDLGDLEEPLRGIVTDCLSKDPAARPQTQALLMRLLGEEGVTPGPAGGEPTAILGQGAAFAGTAAAGSSAAPTSVAGTPPTVPAHPAAATAAGRPARGGFSPRALAAVAGVLLAAGVAAVVIWVAAQGGGNRPSGGTGTTPVPSGEPSTSERQAPAPQPTRHRQRSSVPYDTGHPTTTPTEPTPTPPGDSSAPGDDDTPGPGDGGDQGGGTQEPDSGVTQPAVGPS